MQQRGGMRGVNPRAMKTMMKQMGMQSEELSVKELYMKTNDGKAYRITNPGVTKIVIQGQTTFQVVGEMEPVVDDSYSIAESKDTLKNENNTLPAEDIELVCMQTGASKQKAEQALMAVKGNPAEAIVKLLSGDFD